MLRAFILSNLELHFRSAEIRISSEFSREKALEYLGWTHSEYSYDDNEFYRGSVTMVGNEAYQYIDKMLVELFASTHNYVPNYRADARQK